MSRLPDLSSVESVARAELDEKFAAREVAITNGRQVIRAAANSIRAFHRGDIDDAEGLLAKAAELLAESTAALEPHPDVSTGIVADAAKEFAEAHLTIALGHNEPLPLPSDLGVRVAPYLNGLGEAVGELRRRMLDQLRAGELTKAEETFAAMDEVHGLLAGLDYPDGMTGGLRRTTDVARALIERSRADLTTTLIQERLRAELADRNG